MAQLRRGAAAAAAPAAPAAATAAAVADAGAAPAFEPAAAAAAEPTPAPSAPAAAPDASAPPATADLPTTTTAAPTANDPPTATATAAEPEFLVKWAGRAHVHAEWLPASAVASLSRRKLLNFRKRHGSAPVLLLEPAWGLPERLVARRRCPGGPGWEVLVKWRGLGYEAATWEVRVGRGPWAVGQGGNLSVRGFSKPLLRPRCCSPQRRGCRRMQRCAPAGLCWGVKGVGEGGVSSELRGLMCQCCVNAYVYVHIYVYVMC